MIRKSLFWGLTLVLVVALVSLIIRGRRLEKEQPRGPVEIVQESKPSLTRVLTPSGLELMQSRMRLAEKTDKSGESVTAHHEIEILNSGDVVYEGIQLRFDYLNRKGKVLSTKTCFVAQKLMPGRTLKLDDIRIEDVPISTENFRVAIDFADMAPAPVSPEKGMKG